LGNEQPSFEVVYEYARKSVDFFISKHAKGLNRELREECVQDAMLRTWRAFKKLDETKAWKSFVQKHCCGAVLDFLKSAKSFEDGYGVKSDNPDALRTRVEGVGEGGAVNTNFNFSLEDGPNAPQVFSPKWELVYRMSGKDLDLHIIAKILLGYTQDAIAIQMGLQSLGVKVSRERISQRLYEFFDRLDSCEFMHDPWTMQCIFALGLSAQYREPEVDQGIGWDLKSFDLADPLSFKFVQRYYKPTLFDNANIEELSSASYSANEIAI
jgi:hypothetical protein